MTILLKDLFSPASGPVLYILDSPVSRSILHVLDSPADLLESPLVRADRKIPMTMTQIFAAIIVLSLAD